MQGKQAINEFTVREHEVLKRLSEGMNDKEIAGQLFISTETGHSHRKSLLKKINTRNVASLMVYALKKLFIK